MWWTMIGNSSQWVSGQIIFISLDGDVCQITIQSTTDMVLKLSNSHSMYISGYFTLSSRTH